MPACSTEKSTVSSVVCGFETSTEQVRQPPVASWQHACNRHHTRTQDRPLVPPPHLSSLGEREWSEKALAATPGALFLLACRASQFPSHPVGLPTQVASPPGRQGRPAAPPRRRAPWPPPPQRRRPPPEHTPGSPARSTASQHRAVYDSTAARPRRRGSEVGRAQVSREGDTAWHATELTA